MQKKNEVYEQGKAKMISEEDINKARQDLVKYANEWRKRKRGCMDILDMICESADLNRKEFMVRK